MVARLIHNASTDARLGEMTRAWILRRGEDGQPRQEGKLELVTMSLPPATDDDILVETLYGSWEANMTHALRRDPIDVCRRLGQDWIVLGNSGVVRVLANSRNAAGPNEGTVCNFVPIGKVDRSGYVKTVCAYDEPGTMGVLAERLYLKPSQLIALPEKAKVDLVRWASFPNSVPIGMVELARGLRCVAVADARHASGADSCVGLGRRCSLCRVGPRASAGL